MEQAQIFGIVQWSATGHISEANDRFLDLLGYDREHLRGGTLRWDALTPPEYAAIHRAKMDELFATGSCGFHEKELIHADGRRLPVIVASALLPDFPSEGAAVVIHRDGGANEIHRLGNLALLDSAVDAVVLLDARGAVALWSRGAEVHFGIPREQALGSRLEELLGGVVPATILPAVEERGSWQGIVPVGSGARRELDMRWSVVRIFGATQGFLMIASDVTERRRMEARLQRRERIEAIGALAGGVAHDLNNVLMSVSIGANLLSERSRDATTAEVASHIGDSARRAGGLVTQLLTFARGVGAAHTAVDVARLLANTLRIVQQALPPTVRIECDVPIDVWPIAGDANQLHQVLLNVCLHARDAMPAGEGMLSLSAANVVLDEGAMRQHPQASPGEYILLEVRHNGVGVGAEDLPKLFEPYFSPQQEESGIGLGLSTALEIIKGHGGFITVDSAIDRDTVFGIHLPLATDEGRETPPLDAAVKHGNGEVALVVDDEKSILEITRLMLEAFGYQVLTASDGAEAVAIYSSRRVDVVIVDLRMPVMDGMATIQALRRVDPEVVVVLVSGEAESAAVTTGTAVRFLPKPYTAVGLLKVLEKALLRGGREEGARAGA